MRVLTGLALSILLCTACQKVTLRARPAPNAVQDLAAPADSAARAASAVPEAARARKAQPASGASSTAGASSPARVASPAASASGDSGAPPAPVPMEDTSPAVPGRAAAAPRAALRVGVLAPLSGRYASYGKAYFDGAVLAAESFNQQGPTRVEIVPADTKGEPLAALAATRRLIADDRLLAILGSVLSLPTVVAALEANCNAVPLLSNVATEDGLADIGPYVFHDGVSRQSAARAGAEIVALELRCFRSAVLYPEEGDGRALALAFGERLAELGGEVVFSEAYPSGTTDFTSVLRRLAGAQPEVVYIPAGMDDMLLIAPALAFTGLSAQLLGTEEWASERLLKSMALDLEGALLPANPLARRDAELARFRSLYRARFSGAENRFAAAGFLGASRILDALEQSPGADRESVRRALEARRQSESGTTSPARRFFVVHDGEALPFGTP